MILHLLMQNWWYLYKPLEESCEVIKFKFAKKIYGFLSHISLSCADNAIFELLFRVAHLYWKILLSFILFIYLSKLFIS